MSIRAVGTFFDYEVSRSRAASVTNALRRVKKTSSNTGAANATRAEPRAEVSVLFEPLRKIATSPDAATAAAHSCARAVSRIQHRRGKTQTSDEPPDLPCGRCVLRIPFGATRSHPACDPFPHTTSPTHTAKYRCRWARAKIPAKF